MAHAIYHDIETGVMKIINLAAYFVAKSFGEQEWLALVEK